MQMMLPTKRRERTMIRSALSPGKNPSQIQGSVLRSKQSVANDNKNQAESYCLYHRSSNSPT